MRVFFIFSCSLHFVSGDTTLPYPKIICSFSGETDYRLKNTSNNPDFEPNAQVQQMPTECEAILYGHYYIDENKHVSDSDLEGIKVLTRQGKRVYARITYKGDVPSWFEIINSMSETAGGDNYTQYIEPIISDFIKTYKVDGVVLDRLNLFNAGDNVQPDYATKLVYLAQQMKREVDTLKIGVIVNGYQNNLFKREDLFNFTTANLAVNLYVIDMESNDIGCNADTANSGRFPIKGTNMSLEAVNAAVSKSTMNQDTTVINFIIKASSLDTSSQQHFRTYKQYCEEHQPNMPKSPDLWCRDTMQMCRDQAVSAKPVYAAMMLSYMDYDDYDGSCNCTIFPVANAFIGGWNNPDVTIRCPPIG